MPIKDFHIHLYFNLDEEAKAQRVAGTIQAKFSSVELGRFHQGPVGPHPIGSVQILVRKEEFGEVLSLVALKHEGLTVFCHPNTGDDLLDHTEHAIWLGRQVPLNLGMFK
jgi:aromatic ring-cleaving dioxygenase